MKQTVIFNSSSRTLYYNPGTGETRFREDGNWSISQLEKASLDNHIQNSFHYIPDLIINTSCEHIDDNTYSIWLSYVPSNTLVVLQSNNMFRVKDHINCVNSLDEFELKCGLSKIEFADQIEFDNGDKRFMIMGYK